MSWYIPSESRSRASTSNNHPSTSAADDTFLGIPSNLIMHTAHSPLRASHLDIENMAQDNESNDSSSEDASIASGNSGVSGVSNQQNQYTEVPAMCEFQATGVIVAHKLRRMDPIQRIYAEMLLSKIMMYGLLNQLSPSSDIIKNILLDPNQVNNFQHYHHLSMQQIFHQGLQHYINQQGPQQ